MRQVLQRFTRDSDSHGNIVGYVLVLVVIVQTIYPMTIGDSAIAYTIYNILYALLMVSGVLVTSQSPKLMWVVIILGISWLIFGVSFGVINTITGSTSNPDFFYILALIVIGLFQAVVMQVLATYVFSARVVTREVLFAAIAVYWLLGGFFGSIFGVLEGSTFLLTGQNAFVDGVTGVTGNITPWQTTLYYSYATLTTLGYGDVLPVTGWARSLASAEAMVGVLYTTIIVARLVGVYVSDADHRMEAKLKEELSDAN